MKTLCRQVMLLLLIGRPLSGAHKKIHYVVPMVQLRSIPGTTVWAELTLSNEGSSKTRASIDASSGSGQPLLCEDVELLPGERKVYRIEDKAVKVSLGLMQLTEIYERERALTFTVDNYFQRGNELRTARRQIFRAADLKEFGSALLQIAQAGAGAAVSMFVGATRRRRRSCG
jgi:hypothetical protein